MSRGGGFGVVHQGEWEQAGAREQEWWLWSGGQLMGTGR